MQNVIVINRSIHFYNMYLTISKIGGVYMAKIQAFIATLVCGFSTFTVTPVSNYFRHIPLNSGSITNEAWQMTGSNLKDAMDKVGVQVNGESKN